MAAAEKRKQFSMCDLPTMFHCHRFNAPEVLKGAESAPSPYRVIKTAYLRGNMIAGS